MKFPLLASITFVFILAAGAAVVLYYPTPSFLSGQYCNAAQGVISSSTSSQYEDCCHISSPSVGGKTCNIFGKRIEISNYESYTCANSSGAFRNLLFKLLDEASCSRSYYYAKLTTYVFLWNDNETDKDT